MNPVLRDKCAARRIARAGCVDAIGIVRASRMDTVRPLSNAERISAWRNRSGRPGFGGCYVRPYQSMPATSHEPVAYPLGDGEVAGALSKTGDC